MSGPSLTKHDAHSSIHEAALNEAKELRELYQKCIENDDIDKALQVAEITIEHWESRTLQHAEAEETGLYKDLVAKNPKLQETIIQLTRDHDLMRRIVEQMKENLVRNVADDSMLKLMDSLFIIDEMHNEDEMMKLLKSAG